MNLGSGNFFSIFRRKLHYMELVHLDETKIKRVHQETHKDIISISQVKNTKTMYFLCKNFSFICVLGGHLKF